MGITNILAGTDDKLARLRGELLAKQAELQRIEESVQRISALHHEIAELERAIEGGETLLKYLHPEWTPSKAKARRSTAQDGPFKFGERGQIALGILRNAPTGMTTRDIMRQSLLQVGVVDPDRATLDRHTNSLSNYLKKHEGDLVKSDHGLPQKWSVIRDSA